MKRIIITGSTGFIGSSLVTRLSNDNEIAIVVRKNSNIPESFKEINIDIFIYNENIDELINFFKSFNPDLVIHLASLFIAEHNSSQIKDLISSNIIFGTHILEAMKESDTNILINTGTFWQNFDGDEYNPVCLYAATKEAFEKIIEFYVQLYNFKALTLKLFDTYGENDSRKKLFHYLKSHIISNSPINMSEGYQELNLTHVQDICDAFNISMNLIQKENFNGHKKFYVKNEKSYSLRKVVKIIEKITEKRLKINWGAKNYRKREVMKIIDYKDLLPYWKPKISLEKGLKKIFSKG